MTKFGDKGKGLLKNYSQNDERYTPVYAIEPLLRYIPKDYLIYEPCGINEQTGLKSAIPQVFGNAGYTTHETSIHDGVDFLTMNPKNFVKWNRINQTQKIAIVTNPPYSQKTKFLKKCYELRVPFGMLLPTTSLEGIERNQMFRTYGLQLIIPDRRIEFTGAGKVWYHTSWFTYGLNLPNDLNFEQLRYNEQKGES